MEDFADYQLDLAAVMREVVLPDCPARIFALCHSMSAVVALDALLEGRRWFDRLVLMSPCSASISGRRAGRNGARRRRCAGRSATPISPAAGTAPSPKRPFATNPVTLMRAATKGREMVAVHPHLALGAPTISWLAAAFDIMERLAQPEVIRQIRAPFFMLARGERTGSSPTGRWSISPHG